MNPHPGKKGRVIWARFAMISPSTQFHVYLPWVNFVVNVWRSSAHTSQCSGQGSSEYRDQWRSGAGYSRVIELPKLDISVIKSDPAKPAAAVPPSHFTPLWWTHLQQFTCYILHAGDRGWRCCGVLLLRWCGGEWCCCGGAGHRDLARR